MYEARLKMLTKFMQRNMFHNCANYKSMASTNKDFSTSPKGSLLLNSFCNVQTGIGSGHMFKSPSNDWEIRTTLKIPWVIMRPYEYLITFSLVSSGSPTQVKCPINTSTVIQRYLNFTVNGFQSIWKLNIHTARFYSMSKLNKMLEWSCNAVSILLYTLDKHSSSLGDRL